MSIIILLIFLLILIINIIFKSYFIINIPEYLRLLINLYLIYKIGFIDINKNYLKINKLNNDPKNVKTHDYLRKKYGKMIKINIPISTFGNMIYILDYNLSKTILKLTPEIFGPGVGKKSSFNFFMKNNVGVSENKEWRLRRKFNENSLDTQTFSQLSFNLNKMINDIMIYPKKIDGFKKLGLLVSSKLIYNDDSMVNELNTFFNLADEKVDIYKCPFMKFYKDKTKKIYDNINQISILNNFKINNFNQNIDYIDQIPHCFGPFIAMIKHFIPILLCIILNFPEIKNKIKNEINNKSFNLYSKRTYFHYCVIEHIRLYNTITINMDRTALFDYEIDGVEFKKGDKILLFHTGLLYDEEIYNKPNLYIPERWKNKSIVEQNEVFGHGPQQCPSVNITPLIYKILIKNLLDKDYKLVSPIIKYEEIENIDPYSIEFEY